MVRSQVKSSSRNTCGDNRQCFAHPVSHVHWYCLDNSPEHMPRTSESDALYRIRLGVTHRSKGPAMTQTSSLARRICYHYPYVAPANVLSAEPVDDEDASNLRAQA